MLIYKAFRWVQHIQKLIFSEQISIKISTLFWDPPLDIIFIDFGTTWYQKAWFWEPLGAQLGTKRWIRPPRRERPGAPFSRIEFSMTFRNNVASFLFPLGSILAHFGRMLYRFWILLAWFLVMLTDTESILQEWPIFEHVCWIDASTRKHTSSVTSQGNFTGSGGMRGAFK